MQRGYYKYLMRDRSKSKLILFLSQHIGT
jgi:hypothetical protein